MNKKITYEELLKENKRLQLESTENSEQLQAVIDELTESRDDYQSLTETMKDVVVRISITGRLLYVSPAIFDFAGYQPEEEIGNHISKYMASKRDFLKALQLIKDVVLSHKNGTFEFRFKPKDKNKEAFWVEHTYVPIIKNNKVHAIQLIMRDSRERIEAEISIRNSEEYHRAITENSVDAISIIDAKGNNIYQSNSAKTIFGYNNRMGKTIFDVLHHEDKVAIEKLMKDGIQKYGVVYPIKFRAWHKDGSLKYLEGTAKNMLNSPVVNGIIINFRDVSNRILIEKELQQQGRYLLAINKAAEILSVGNPRDKFLEYIKIVGEVSRASRSYIFENSFDAKGDLLMSQVVEYVTAGIEPEIANQELQDLSYKEWFPDWMEELSNGRIIKGKTEDFGQKQKEFLQQQHIQAVLIVPINVDGVFWGFIGFDNCENDNLWSDSEIEYLKAVATKIESSIEVFDKQKFLKTENERFRATMDAMDTGVYVADMHSYEILFMNKFFIGILGDKTGELCYKSFHKDQEKPCDFCTNNQLLSKTGKPADTIVWEHYNNISEKWYQLRDKAIRWIDGRLVRFEIASDITERKMTEQVVLESEGRLKAFSGVTSEAIFFSENGICIEANEAACKLTGFAYEELIGKPALSSFTPESMDLVRKNMKSGYNKPYDVIALKKDGSSFDAEIHGRRFNYQGKEVRVTAIRDVSNRKKVEQNLRNFSQVVEIMNQLVCITTLEGNIVYVNNAVLKLSGFTKEELVDKSVYTLTDKEGAEKLKQEILPSLFQHGSYSGELVFKKKDNTSYLGEMNNLIITDNIGKPKYLVALFSDITEQRRKEDELKQVVRQTEIVMEGSNIGWWDWHIPSGDEKYNRILPRLLGYELNEIKPHISWWEKKVHEDDKAQVAIDIQEHFENQTEFYVNVHRLQTKDGQWKWFMDYGKVVERDQNDKPIRMVGTLRDIDLEKKSRQHIEEQNRELIIAKEKAEESDRLKSAFLSNMSHEIRTPMNGILGFTELLKEPDISDQERKEFIKVIERGGERMLNTINDIIDISKIETGQETLHLNEFNLKHTLMSLCEFFKVQAKEKNIAFSLDYNTELDNLVLFTDKTKLNSILTNLIKNAIKYTLKGKVSVIVNRLENTHIKISIKDTGIGVPLHRHKAIFNRFEQADIEDRDAMEGSGLGLAIAKAYVKMLGGEIGLNSELKKGSEFWFTIPV
ncbi:MAG: hypothetical protein B7C24_02890 [Bacteroidetes bacterium 4572_77]|nr:MAG: hypothetical protein B7C24_02890 [Bacteroidetes bacterium 4572_77]